MNLLKRHDSCSFIVIIDWSPWPSLSVCSSPCFQAIQWEQEQYRNRAVKKTHPALLDFCHVLWEAVCYILPWMKKSCMASLLTACCLLQMWRAVPAMGWFPGSGHCFGFVSCQRGQLAVCSPQSAYWDPFKWELKCGGFCCRFLLSATKPPNSGT